ncbi:seryl-tRNA protein [Apiospora marii]|uniref:serine--tRNA ligase n=1 Tax=Apiospora marii TaxID=335849 RepID=A0ABR1RBY8_9PEZI
MRPPQTSFVCMRCRFRPSQTRLFHASAQRRANPINSSLTTAAEPASSRPTTAPRPSIDIKHIRQNPTLYEQNCLERNYKAQSAYPAQINILHQQWQEQQRDARHLRERSNLLRKQIANSASTTGDEDPATDRLRSMSKEELLAEAKQLKEKLSTIEQTEDRLTSEIEDMALAIPNLTSDSTPRGDEALVLSYINDHPEPVPSESDRVWRSHVHIGSELGLLDFAGAATSTGWGWYYLLDQGARLEQALIQFALAVATQHGWQQVTPPSIVYGHIAAACGFQPRDQHGETQIYNLAQSAADRDRGKPELVLAGTAEIPLAGMKADTLLEEAELPLKRVAVSRCYRAEAGARGVDTKGLYRVHEFNKVELFAWTEPNASATAELFDEIVDIQTEILEMLGLHCRVLEMPSADLGASAARKCDIEAFFPSRRQKNDGWGEVTSASICTDYQTRRLATRVKTGGKMTFPWTVNGTALAVPRVLAAILENGWDENEMHVKLPECLWELMGTEVIGMKHRIK